jgi:hypothetical protein
VAERLAASYEGLSSMELVLGSSVKTCFPACVHNDKRNIRMSLCSLQHRGSNRNPEIKKGYSDLCIVFTPKLINPRKLVFPLTM